MYDIPFDRSFLQLSNGIRHVMPSTHRKLELTAKASMAQPVSQPAVCSNGLMYIYHVTTDRQTVFPVRYELYPEKQVTILNITVEQGNVFC